MLKAEKVNERQASKRHRPPPSPPRKSNSNKRPPPPHPLEWQWIPLSTNKRLPRVQSFLQSILQKPCFVTSSCFVVSVYCFVANEHTTLAENCKNLISAQRWIRTNSLCSCSLQCLEDKVSCINWKLCYGRVHGQIHLAAQFNSGVLWHFQNAPWKARF